MIRLSVSFKWALSIAVIIVLNSSCGGGDDDTVTEDSGVGVDTSGGDTDSDTDSDTDTDTDTDTDADSDADSDTDTDSDTDSDTDTDTDSDADAGSGGGGDVSDGSTGSLSLVEVQPQAASRYLDTELTLIGTGFVTGMNVTLFNEDVTPQTINIGAAVAEVGGESATVVLHTDPDRPQGLYDLTVTVAGVGSATLEDAIFVSEQEAPIVTNVEPTVAWVGNPMDSVLSDRTVQIQGENFAYSPWVKWVSVADPELVYQAVDVDYINTENLTVIIPSESAPMEVGAYYVFVTNPDNLSGQWIDPDSSEPGEFVVVSSPPPMISAIDPVQHEFNDACVPFTITGLYFHANAEVSLLTASGEEPLPVDSVSPEGTLITASIPKETVEIGYYPVKVTNPDDGQFDLFYAFEAKNPTDGHFYGNFAPVDTAMNVARERLGLEYGFDAYGGTHLYATGGLDEANVVRGDMETTSVNIYGEVGQWRTLRQWGGVDNPRIDNVFNTARSGHALVRVGEWLYAIGGNGNDTSVDLLDTNLALASVESARILRSGTMPEIISLTRVDDGDLPLGTWYFRVSSIGPLGESLSSGEAKIANTDGTVRVCWEKVAGATQYNIYRSVAADGRPGTTRLVATADDVGPGTTMCFDDDGSVFPAPGFLSGTVQTGGTLAVGTWAYQVSALVNAEESLAGYAIKITTETGNGTVELCWDEVPGATGYNVYRSDDIVADVDQIPKTFLFASGLTTPEWIDDGTPTTVPEPRPAAPDGVRVLPVGSLSAWQTVGNELGTAREGLGAVAIAVPLSDTGDMDAGVDAGFEWNGEHQVHIYAVGGRPHGGANGYLTSAERAQVAADGQLGPWSALEEELETPRAFFSLFTSQRREMSPISSWPGDDLDEGNIFLFAIAGDESFDPLNNNTGLTTIEASEVNAPDGTLSSWVIQDGDLSSGRKTYAGGGAVVDQYLYCIPGVKTEQAGTDGVNDYEPIPLGSGSLDLDGGLIDGGSGGGGGGGSELTSRFEMIFDDPLSDPYNDLLTNYMSSNGGLETPRSYYGVVRVNAHIYIVGGNDGTGPIASVENIPQ